MFWNKKAGPSLSTQYPSASVTLDAVEREYTFELERGGKLDARVNITITFAGVLFLYIIKFFDFHFIPRSLPTPFYQVCGVLQILDVAFYIAATLFLLTLLLNRRYYHFNAKELLIDPKHKDGPNYRIEDPSMLQIFLFTQYLAMNTKNSETNEKRAHRYNLSVYLLVAVVSFSFILEILVLNFTL